MFIIPFQIPPGRERGPIVVVLVLEKENLERMQQGDPLDCRFRDYAAFIPSGGSIWDLDFILAYEEDLEPLVRFKKDNDLPGLLRWLERGREITAQDGSAPLSWPPI